MGILKVIILMKLANLFVTGLYIRDGDKDWPKEFHSIGVRIEDDVLVTENGCIVLSSGCLKSRSQIENLVSQKHKSKG